MYITSNDNASQSSAY